ncbi:MAG: 30S ribosomal protein S17 [Microgenomates group bacterium Gr01-1014_93]|nr:MAG: 30S ribosomal protein S17 [Microgenomates group bacterium Gr01-1014_93]
MKARVTSIKMAKTVSVIVESKKTHPLYGKSYVSSKKYLADDQIGVSLGDIVEIEKIRPVSKYKHWRVVKIIGKDVVEIIEEKLKEEAEGAIEEVMPASLAGGPDEKEKDKQKEPVVDDSVDKKKLKEGRKTKVAK